MNLYVRNFPPELNKTLKRVALEKGKSKELVVIEILQSWPHLKKYGEVRKEEEKHE